MAIECIEPKATMIDMKYFAGSKFFGSLVHKKNFGLIWQVVFMLRFLFCQELEEKLQATIILGKLLNKP